MTKKPLDNLIPFPMEKVNPEPPPMSYHEIVHGTAPEDLTDKELVFCINNTALAMLGDAYDEKFWSRRISAILKLGVSLGHPEICDVFSEIKPDHTILFEKDRFDVCAMSGNRFTTVIELKCMSALGPQQLSRYSEKLVKKKSEDAPRFVVSMFDLDIDQIPSPWYEIGLTFFSSPFAEISDILIGNPEIANDFNNCHDFLVLIDELVYRFNSAMSGFTESDKDIDEMKAMAIKTGFFKPLDRIVKSITSAQAMKILKQDSQRCKLLSGNTNGNNFFNVSTDLSGVEVGIQYQNDSVKLYRNSAKSTPYIDEKVRQIAEDITGKKVKFTSDRGKGFRSIRLNERGSPADAWSVEGKLTITDLISRSIRCLNEA